MSGSAVSKHIGLLGAAFDPPHFGHFLLAQLALEKGNLDEIWLMPCPARWDKKPVASGQQRTHWLELAMALCPTGLKEKLYLCQDELKQKEYRGTNWLVNELRLKHPLKTFALILGWDSFVSIPAWRDPVTNSMNGNELLKSTRCFVSPRATSAASSVPHPHHHNGGVVMLPALDSVDPKSITWMEELSPIQVAALSSSLIRTAIASKSAPKFIFSDVQESIINSRCYEQVPQLRS